MDIAALSMGLGQMKISQEASVSVMKMAMDMATDQLEDLTKVMEASINPDLGGNIDISL